MISYGPDDLFSCRTVPQFSPFSEAFTACLETMPHWLNTGLVLVAAGFAVLLLVGLFQPTTTVQHPPSRHEDSL